MSHDMATLLASSSFIGKDCREANGAFILCKKNNQDPEACLLAGSAVIDCASTT